MNCFYNRRQKHIKVAALSDSDCSVLKRWMVVLDLLSCAEYQQPCLCQLATINQLLTH